MAPIIVFMSMVTSMLYYTGIMSHIIEKIAWGFQRTCGTTGPESMVVISNIFLSHTESPLMIKVSLFRYLFVKRIHSKPYIDGMTESEFFVVMCSGLASVAGSVMGAFIEMGKYYQ